MAPDTETENARRRILVVDDEEIVLAGLKETLSRAGYEVTATRHPHEALEWLQKNDCAVVISDYQMPHMTGLRLLVEARRLRPDTSRILVTAVLGAEVIIDAINRAEILRFLMKPWLREEFLQAVEAGVRRWEQLTRARELEREVEDLRRKIQRKEGPGGGPVSTRSTG